MAELNAAYMKYIKSKTSTCNIIRSCCSSSGTLSAIYRAIYLKNNYCLYDNDNILYLTKNITTLENAKEFYSILTKEFDCTTLFSTNKDRVDFLTVDELVDVYFKEYLLGSPLPIKLAGDGETYKIIKESLNTIKHEYKGLKLLTRDYSEFFKDEVKWLKAFGYSELDDYQNCDRTGRRYKKGEGPSRLIKNSAERDAIHRLYKVYEDKLSGHKLMDYEDKDQYALKKASEKIIKKYTHIFLDESRLFTKKQLQMINLLKDGRAYGETTYIYDSKSSLPLDAFLIKPGKISEISQGERVKSTYFRKPFESEILELIDRKESKQVVRDLEMRNKDEAVKDYSVEKFQFINLKNGREFNFIRDISRKDSILLVNDNDTLEVKPKEMKELPVFSNIAAGAPILMNPEVEDTFYLPHMWVKGLDNHFILHVKGDSMIGAGIDDGDYVVVKSSPTAQSGDIVAVNIDGSATLKRLMLKDYSALLMPENEKYRPIEIREEGAYILGIAIGVLKSSNQ